MDHAVHYRTSDGATRFEEAGSLEAAVAMVERLRNEQGATDVRVYRQVPIEFKTYYKAVVADASGTPAVAPSAPASGATSEAPPAPQAPAAPQTPPPGAMPLGPSGPAQAASAPNGKDDEGDGDSNRRGSLFSRG